MFLSFLLLQRRFTSDTADFGNFMSGSFILKLIKSECTVVVICLWNFLSAQ
jgi:hypothetical protein